MIVITLINDNNYESTEHDILFCVVVATLSTNGPNGGDDDFIFLTES